MDDNYAVKLLPRAYRDLDGIYEYIAETLTEPGIATKLLDSLEEAIFGLECMPKRGALRKTGAYASKGYRQLFVGNFTVLYRVEEAKKWVLVVAAAAWCGLPQWLEPHQWQWSRRRGQRKWREAVKICRPRS